MIKHLFKLIWKQKKSNFLMMSEIFISFLILFAVGTLGVFFLRNYKQPEGLSTERVWAVYCSINTDTLREYYRELIRHKIQENKEIEYVSLVDNNIPYSFSSSNRFFAYEKNTMDSEFMRCDAEMLNVLKLHLTAGKWLSEPDQLNKYTPIIINQVFKDQMFGLEDPVGKLLNIRIPGSKENFDEGEGYQVLGVVENFKFENEYTAIRPCIWTWVGNSSTDFLVKVKPEADANFEAKLNKDLLNLGSGWSIEIQHLDDMKNNKNKLVLVPMLILLIVCGFLVFNVALGLFGVLFQTITRRKSEIGVRRAMGATKGHILIQFIGETLFIASLGMLLGVFFAIQFPLMNVFDVEKSTYFAGILIAMISIYLLVILCAMLPSRQAIQIYPALALHED